MGAGLVAAGAPSAGAGVPGHRAHGLLFGVDLLRLARAPRDLPSGRRLHALQVRVSAAAGDVGARLGGRRVSDLTWTRGGAEFSDDGRFRFKLWRRWNTGAAGRIVCFVMLNPSQADGVVDDATIRRCIGFAKRWGYDGIDVVNLLAVVETHSDRLPAIDDAAGDPRCVEALIESALGAALVVVAWGAGARFCEAREREVLVHLRRARVPLHMFKGETRSGCPRHPLRLAASHRLICYMPAAVPVA